MSRYLFRVRTSKFVYYVDADEFDEAVDVVENYLTKHDMGTEYERVVLSVEVVAERAMHPRANGTNVKQVGTLLPLQPV